jgi:hypothetical protein
VIGQIPAEIGFVYPAESRCVPRWVMEDLIARLEMEQGDDDGRVCRGTLLSREQYIIDLKRGYTDARLPPCGSMSSEEVTIWTAAIADRR